MCVLDQHDARLKLAHAHQDGGKQSKYIIAPPDRRAVTAFGSCVLFALNVRSYFLDLVGIHELQKPAMAGGDAG